MVEMCIRSKYMVRDVYYTERKPRLLILANSAYEVEIYKKSLKTAGKLALAQKIEKACYPDPCKRFILQIFHNEEYMITRGDKGAHALVWYINDNGLIPLYRLGSSHIFRFHPKSNIAFFVQIEEKNTINLIKTRSKPQLPPEDFKLFKLILSLFSGEGESVASKSKINEIVNFYTKVLSTPGQNHYKRNSSNNRQRDAIALAHSPDIINQLLLRSIGTVDSHGRRGSIFIQSIVPPGDDKIEPRGAKGSLFSILSKKERAGPDRKSQEDSGMSPSPLLLPSRSPKMAKGDSPRRRSAKRRNTHSSIRMAPKSPKSGSKEKTNPKINSKRSPSRSPSFRSKKGYTALDRIMDDRIIHSQLQPLLLAVLSKDHHLLTKTLAKFGYKPYYYERDLNPHQAPNFSMDPLDVALKINKLRILDALARYLKEGVAKPTPDHESSRKNLFLSYLSIRRFREIMKCSSELLREVTLEQCFFEPSSLASCSLIELYPIPVRGFRIFKSTGLLFDPDLKADILKRADLKSKHYKNEPVRVKMFRFPFSSSLFSKSAQLLLQAALTMSDSMLKTDYKYIIIYIWRENFYTILAMTTFNILSYVLFVLYIVWFGPETILGACSITSSFVLLTYELVIMVKNFKRWASSLYNYLDIFQYINMPLIVSLHLLRRLPVGELYINMWINFTLLIAGFRTFAELRIFDSIRTLIAMINQTMIDMTSFIVTMFSMILIFCIVSINVSKTTEQPMLGLKDILLSLDYYYNLANGNWEPDISQGFNSNQLIIFYISGIILAIMMMNLLIAVISLTFDKFYEIQELVDIRVRTEILYDHSEFFSKLKKIFWFLPFLNTPEEAVNHCFLIKNEASITDEVMKNFKQLDSKIEKCREEFDEVKELIRDEMEEVKEQVENKAMRVEEVSEQMELKFTELRGIMLQALEAVKNAGGGARGGKTVKFFEPKFSLKN